ncbi:restriction endonuclease subunit S [Spiroplasma attinicola]|uniref:restriction endonuclease subunit S n=1 Tax=Spiroplasma attinicola TaxID=2904537 RepID=UPI002022B30B|nr:restriction endonuclease subunit S [Spiroplasma sp. JKS002670]MCL8209776.1 hypothetical protein [Spiroplasma sp. JKS002670]
MAVYKLKEIGKLNYSKSFINESNGIFPIYATSGIVSFTNNPTFEENSIILPRVGNFNIFFSSKKHSTKNTAFSYKIDKSKANSKYIYFKLLKVNLTNENMGSVVPRLTSSFWNKFKINMPSLKIQNQIIDIIKPLEDIEINLLNIKNKLIKFLINLYNCSNHNNQISFNSVIKILVSKYENQINYFATNAVGEMQIDYQKIINLSEKIPSRANISPWKDSFIFSKLAGENKIFYFKNKPQEVFSTGFFNFKAKHHDHILGFILSDDFKKQKEYLATGTTMQSINNSSLKLIRLNKPNLKSSIITTTLYDLENNLIKIKKLKTKLINLLIKSSSFVTY